MRLAARLVALLATLVFPFAARARPLAPDVPAGPFLPFVPLPSCRVADTRGNGFQGAFGPPSMTPGAGRIFPVGGQCGVPSDAVAVSFNFIAARTAGVGYLLVYPAKAQRPGTSTLNYSGGQALANGAIVSLGAEGAVTAEIYGAAADLVIDVNGYFGGGLVTSLNGKNGDVSILGGANVTITPSGNSLIVSATSTPGPAGPAGPPGPSSGGRHHFQSTHPINGAIGALYMSPLTSFASPDELGPAVALIPSACTMTSLRVFVTAPAGVSVSEAFTLRTGTSMVAIDESSAVSDLADTALTCTIFQGGQTCSATGAVALPAGQLFDFKVDVLGGFAPDTQDAVVSVVCE